MIRFLMNDRRTLVALPEVNLQMTMPMQMETLSSQLMMHRQRLRQTK